MTKGAEQSMASMTKIVEWPMTKSIGHPVRGVLKSIPSQDLSRTIASVGAMRISPLTEQVKGKKKV